MYDPFGRGSLPVGVRTLQVARGTRELPYELWYPATPTHFGLDVSPVTQDRFSVLPNTPAQRQSAVRDAETQPGSYPLLIYSHTSLGHRRQSTFLCTHLASHGYLVAAPDHVGNSFADLAARAASGTTLTTDEREALLRRIIADRVPDLRATCDAVLSQTETADAGRLGVIGWSFGGWAALSLPETDTRFKAVVAIVPGGSRNPLPGIIPAELTFAWPGSPSTLYLAAERDRYTPLEGIAELYDRTPAEKRMFVLRHADHDHFGDHFEPELVPRWAAHLFTRSLTLAHLDAVFQQHSAAAEFLAADPAAELRGRGVPALAHPAVDGQETTDR